MNILLGSDPELFVMKDGEFISAHGLIEGDKKNPYIVKRGAIQVDGMALEYNTDPASSLEEWERNHTSVKRSLKHKVGKGFSLKATPTVFFSEEIFNTTPAESKILGCEPDFNAWTENVNPTPNAEVLFRTGAGHIHIGWTEGADITDPFHLGECYALTKMLDQYLGVPSVIMDSDNLRREMYGKAGAFRPKSYGLEYRVLSNFWTESQKLRRWAYNGTMEAIKMTTQYKANNSIRECIDDGNKETAIRHCDHYGINYHV